MSALTTKAGEMRSVRSKKREEDTSFYGGIKMFRTKGKGQSGFTLIELLAVISILAVLAGLVAGTVVGLGSSSQSARLDGDLNIIGKAANAFFLDSFPESYPVVDLSSSVTGNVDGIKEIDFKAGTPDDPNKTFVPDFLTNLPDSAALVSWRIDENSGNVFFAQDGSNLIKPSNNRLDVSATDGGVSDPSAVRSNYLFEFSFAKNEAAPEIVEIEIPNGYSLGGALGAIYTIRGFLQATLSTDNDFDPGQKIKFGGVIVHTATTDKWALVVNYNENATSTSDTANKTLKDNNQTRVHVIDVVSPTDDSSGRLTINFARGDDDPENKATETWELTLLGVSAGKTSSGQLPISLTVDSDGNIASSSSGQGLGNTDKTLTFANGFVVTNTSGATSANYLTNPDTASVFRWSAVEHTTISPVVGDTDFFSILPGSQGVVIK